MSTIYELLRSKSSGVTSIEAESTVYAALEVLAERDLGALLVMEKGAIVGIFSERDYARKVILEGRSSRQTLVRDLMSAPVLFVRPDQTIDDCMVLMTEKRVRHLPVLQDGKLVGMVTIDDIVRRIISEQDYTIEHLENYIQGSH